MTSAQLEANKALLPPVVYRRCRHIIGENERVLATVAALQQGDLATVGQLMDASHASLRDDYEVSSPALDAMVTAMRRAPGVYGARLTGAGFGGCAVALVAAGRRTGRGRRDLRGLPQGDQHLAGGLHDARRGRGAGGSALVRVRCVVT